MLAYEVLGTVPPYWRDLSPTWTPILYLRARKALKRDRADQIARTDESERA